MEFRWTPRLEVGIPAIDAQHQELLARVAQLTDALLTPRSGAELGRMMAFLGEYVVHHFETEERLMDEHRFPEYAAHRLLHGSLVADHARLSAELVRSGPTAALAQAISQRLGSWLLAHIMGADHAFGAFLAGPPADR